jgi:hypothetical protein
VVPNAIVKDQLVLVDLGGQSVTLFYLGRGHTDGDLLVGASTTLYAGDLVEEGAHPSFEDSRPENWDGALLGRHEPALAVSVLLDLHGRVLVRPELCDAVVSVTLGLALGHKSRAPASPSSCPPPERLSNVYPDHVYMLTDAGTVDLVWVALQELVLVEVVKRWHRPTQSGGFSPSPLRLQPSMVQ